MGRINYTHIGIPSTTVLVTGGVIVFLQGFPIWASALWLVAIVWIISMLLYEGQGVVTIFIHECIVLKSSKSDYTVEMIIYVKSRHPDLLQHIELAMQPRFVIPIYSGSGMPQPIDSKFERLAVKYCFNSNFLDRAMKKQGTECDITLWVEASTYKAQWITDGFLIPIKSIIDGKVPSMGVFKTEGGLNKKTRRKKGKQIGITDEQFERILVEASQSLKKLENGKT